MIKKLNVVELKKMMDGQEEILLIDCREQEEWDDAHIEGAIFMPLSRFEAEIGKLDNKNAKIIMQCRSGVRSLKACEILATNGFSDLSNLEGGILDWMDEGYDIIG